MTDLGPTLSEQLEREMNLQTTAVKLVANYLNGQIPFVLLAQHQQWVRPKTAEWQLRVERVEPASGTVHLILMGPWQYRHCSIRWSEHEDISFLNFYRGLSDSARSFDTATALGAWLHQDRATHPYA